MPYYNNIYRLNYARLAVLLLPTMLRKPALVAFLRAIFSQFELIPFLNYRSTTNYRLTHNGQVCYLRAVLNDRFDFEQRRIIIKDGEEMQLTTVWWRQERILTGVPMRDAGALLLGWRGIVAGGMYDFTVRVPQEVFENQQAMALMPALIREYKLASKQFIIIPL